MALASLAWTALAMGLVGGSHCAVMCGAPCAALTHGSGAASVPETQPVHWGLARPVAARTATYHLGRMAGYATAGALAAGAMQGLGWATQQALPLRSVWTLMHVAVLAWGLALLVLARQPAWAESAGRSIWQKVRGLATGSGGLFATGFVWALMPCGLLYSAFLVAALSGGPLEGAFVMLAFALGSGAWLVAGPWVWSAARQRFAQLRGAWGTRLGGLVLCAVAGWALWTDLIVRPSLICQ